MNIKDHFWYYYLNRKENSLFSKYSKDFLYKKLVIQYTYRINSKTKEFIRLFSYFDYFEFYKYQLSFEINDRCFYETILEKSRQKPRFDIDLNLSDKENIKINDIINELIDNIVKVMSNLGILINLEKDIIYCSSHGENKKSVHIIIDNYFHKNNLEAKEFYNLVTENINKKFLKFIDSSVYSKNQQFRILGSQKINSNRIKTFNKTWYYKNRKIKHISYKNINKNLNEKYDQLLISLITNTSYCKFIPIKIKSNIKSNSFKSFKNNNNIKINHKKINSIIENDLNGDFKIRKIKGNLIILDSKKEYFCKICERTHENENPFLLVIDNKILFNCRRESKKYIIIREFYKSKYKIRERNEHINSVSNSINNSINNSVINSVNNYNNKYSKNTRFI